MKHYTHFSEKERENLYFYLLEGKKQCEIAVLISKDPSSISRELKRNSILKEHKFNKNNKEKKRKNGKTIIIYPIKHIRNISKEKVRHEKWDRY